MRIDRALLVIVFAALLLAGCSEKQKEASRLEQEVRNLEESTATDTGSPESVTPDTLSSAAVVGDASAIPPEAQPKVASQPMPPAPTGKGWTVQIASCESQVYARRLVDVFTRRGYQPYVTTITKGDQLYHRVRVGAFADLAQARQLKDELIDRYSVAAWIDQIER